MRSEGNRASRQTDGSISVRYNNLLDITWCMHWIRCVVWATPKMRRSTDVLHEAIFSCILSVQPTRRKRISHVPKPSNVSWMGIFEMNSSEFNEPCHEIHQNSNSDNCNQETNCWDWLKSFVVTDRKLKRNQRIICYIAGHAVALLYCVNKPPVVREKSVKIVTGLPGVPVTEELNLMKMHIQRINCFHRFWYFY